MILLRDTVIRQIVKIIIIAYIRWTNAMTRVEGGGRVVRVILILRGNV